MDPSKPAVVETRLEWEGRTVLDEGDRTSDNFAWLLYNLDEFIYVR